MGEPSAVTRRRERETQLLKDARLRFNKEKQNPTVSRPPLRLYDLQLNKLVSETAGKEYVIASYIWDPSALPEFPKLGPYCKDADNFDKMVLAATELRDDAGEPIVELDMDFESNLKHMNFPEFQCDSEYQQKYFQEVFALVAAEARLRNIRYIWMDSLCIDQLNEAEKAAEISHMSTFYSESTCCVVVSETLRRRYAHRWEERGRDDEYNFKLLWPHGYQAEVSAAYQECWGMSDEVIGWIIGFHDLRVWTFQETLCATELIHRGRNVRIRTSAALKWEQEVHEIGSLSRPWSMLESCTKQLILRKLRSRYLSQAEDRFPTKNVFRMDDNHNYMVTVFDIVQNQRRSATKPQDGIYGLLSLFQDLVRFSMPVQYNVSKVAVMTVLVYLLIRSGVFEALHFEQGPFNSGSHLIEGIPSWLPRHMSMFTLGPDPVRPLYSFAVNKKDELIVKASWRQILKSRLEAVDPVPGIQYGEDGSRYRLQLLARTRGAESEWVDCEISDASDLSTPLKYRSRQNEVIRAATKGGVFVILMFSCNTRFTITKWMVVSSVPNSGKFVKRGWIESEGSYEAIVDIGDCRTFTIQ